MMRVNGVEITADSLLATRAHFVEIYQACIDKSLAGEFRVNDLNKYVESNKERIEAMLAGKSDHTLTFMQRALWIQTGNCPALLA